MKLKLFLLTALSLIGLLLPVKTLAGVPTPGPISVRLGEPKTPTNQDNFKLTFVALEIGGTENIAVSCFKKSPVDSDFVKFQDISLIPGGNTDFCTVNNSILNTVGTYSFKVIANNIKESNIVSVDFNTSGPSTPISYSKEWLNSCDYKIKFKTADDSRTAKIEVYRSDVSPIFIDSGHLISSVTISPNTEGSIVNSVPTCGKEYFFAIRAVDNYENVSGVVGDSSVTTITESTTTTTDGNTSQGALVAGDGSQVTAETTPAAEVTISPEGSTSSESGTAEVLGTKTSKWDNLRWVSIPLILIAVYFFLKSRKRA